MNLQDWRDIRRIFDKAIQLEPADREAFLQVACNGNANLLEQVKKLLRADEAFAKSNSATESNAFSPPAPAQELPLKPGVIIRGFQVGQVLGRGVSGVVYEAVRIGSGSGSPSFSSRMPDRVAIKALYPERFDKDGMLRYDREREALARLQHPNIARFYDAGKTDEGVPYLLIERVDGQSLQECIGKPQKSLSPDELRERVEWMIQIASGVQAAHQKLVLHRDLKPANVMIDPSGRAVLTDFGLARFLEPLIPSVSRTSAGKIMGTPQYMAPEQVHAQPTTLATDVHGLGGILYFLLTGKPPFERPTFLETCQAVRDNNPIAPSVHCRTVPKDLETICLKCLSKNPDSRYQSVETLLQDLNAYQQGRPIQARPVSTLVRFGYWARRNRALSSISAFAIIGGVVSLISIAVLWRKSVAENERAQQNMELAQQNMELAQQTSQQLLAMVGRFTQSLRVAEQNPTTLKLQNDLLSSISHSYDQLPNYTQLDQSILRDIAVCRYKLGLVQKQLGLPDDFLDSTRQAEAIFRQLAQAEPDNPTHWFDLFHCLNNQRLSGEALEAVIKAHHLDKGQTRAYREALAHAQYRHALSLIHNGMAEEAEQLCQQAELLVVEIINEDLQNWLSWKLKGEFDHIWARCSLLVGDQVQALARMETADHAYSRALELMPQVRQIIFLIIRNYDLAFSVHTMNGDWDLAQATLERMEPWVIQHKQLNSQALEEYRIAARFLEARYYVAQRMVNASLAEQHSRSWLESVEQWLAAYPEDPMAQREHLWARAVLSRFASKEELELLRRELLPRLVPVNEDATLYSSVLYSESLSLYLLGERELSQSKARAYLDWAAKNSKTSQPQSEIPYLILGLSPTQQNISSDTHKPSAVDNIEDWKLASWEEVWRHQFQLDCLFPDRPQQTNAPHPSSSPQ